MSHSHKPSHAITTDWQSLVFSYFSIFKIFFIFIFYGVYIVDQGGKHPVLGQSRCDYCLQIFKFFFLYLAEGKKPYPASKLSQYPRMGNSYPVPTRDPQCGTHYQGSAQVVLIFLKCYWSHQSKDEGNLSSVHWLAQSTLQSPFALIFAVNVWLG